MTWRSRVLTWFVGGTRPESTGADHAVDAGAATWAFALPEPSVTRTAPGPQDHAVDAGAAAWAFALPEPGVTRTAPITQDHAVDAGGVAWAFALPQPRVTAPGANANVAGTQGVSVQFGGAATSGVETRVRIRRRLNEIGDARLTMIGAPADLTIPARTATPWRSRTFNCPACCSAGTSGPRAVEIIDGGELLEVTVPCVGHEQRLQDTIISPADGIRIVQLATAAEQIQEIVKLLEGEGFTTGTLPDLGDGQTTDMRFKPAYVVLRAIAEAASAVLDCLPGEGSHGPATDRPAGLGGNA